MSKEREREHREREEEDGAKYVRNTMQVAFYLQHASERIIDALAPLRNDNVPLNVVLAIDW